MKPGVLYKDSFLGLKLHTFLNPAFARIGPRVEIQPIAILNLQATYDFGGYFTTFDQLMSFPSPAVDYSDTELGRRGDAGENYPGHGHLVTLAALLQAKVKNVAVRDNLKFYYADLALRGGDTVFYDQTLDIAQPDEAWTLTNDLDLIYLFDFGLKLGARYTLTHAFYQKKHFRRGEPATQPNGPTHRVGPAVLHTFYDKPERRFNKPTIVFLLQWWARHRWRTGADVHPGVPYIVLGFLFEGDLFPDPANGKSDERGLEALQHLQEGHLLQGDLLRVQRVDLHAQADGLSLLQRRVLGGASADDAASRGVGGRGDRPHQGAVGAAAGRRGGQGTCAQEEGPAPAPRTATRPRPLGSPPGHLHQARADAGRAQRDPRHREPPQELSQEGPRRELLRRRVGAAVGGAAPPRHPSRPQRRRRRRKTVLERDMDFLKR